MYQGDRERLVFLLSLFLGLALVTIGLKECANILDTYTSTTHEGTFLVEDKYVNNNFTLILSDSEENKYIVRVSERDYSLVSEQEEIKAQFKSYKNPLRKSMHCDNFVLE